MEPMANPEPFRSDLYDTEQYEIYEKLCSGVVVSALQDYVAFAWPSARESAGDWLAFGSAAEFLFSTEIPQPLFDPETNLPATNHEVMRLVAKKRGRAIEKLRDAARKSAIRSAYKKPQMFVPDTFVSEQGLPWGVNNDPKETTTYIVPSDDQGMGAIYLGGDEGSEQEIQNFFLSLVHVAMYDAGLDEFINGEQADALGESLYKTLTANKMFRARAVATIRVPVTPMEKPLPKRKRRTKKK